VWVSFKSESHPKPTLAVGINPAHCSNRVIAVARLACRKICCAEWERPGDGSQQLPKSHLLLVPKPLRKGSCKPLNLYLRKWAVRVFRNQMIFNSRSSNFRSSPDPKIAAVCRRAKTIFSVSGRIASIGDFPCFLNRQRCSLLSAEKRQGQRHLDC
jgi:hypothetical protein